MRLHSNTWAVSLLVATSLWALMLGSCSDDAPNAATTNGGSGAGGAAAGTSTGGTSAGVSTAGTSGNVNAGSSAGGVAGSAGASAGNGGGGQTSGGGGSGGTSGGGGNAGSGGAPRVYTIEGCDGPGAGGAGSGGESNAGGDANAGGNPGAPVGGAGDGGASSNIPPISASFTVYDFVTDKPVQTCVDRVSDFDITITGDAPLTVAANLAPGLMPGSVVWTYDGVALMPHNIFPYTLGPDDNGDFQEPTPPLIVGEHVLSITVYADADAMGAVLGQASITIMVIEG